MPETTCQERYESRIEELGRLFKLFREREARASDDENLEDLIVDPEDNIYSYGYTGAFEYIRPNTFRNQPVGFYRWSLEPPLRFSVDTDCPDDVSPWNEYIEEFHLFVDNNLAAHRVEYWCASYFEAERILLKDDDARLLLDIWHECFEGDVAEGAT